jgi:hypothetical protein
MRILTRKLDPQKNPAENQLVPFPKELHCQKKLKKSLTTNTPVPAGSRDQGCRPLPVPKRLYFSFFSFYTSWKSLHLPCCVSRLVNCRLAQFSHSECSTTKTLFFFSNFFFFFVSFVCFGSQLTNLFFCVLLSLPTSRVPNLS